MTKKRVLKLVQPKFTLQKLSTREAILNEICDVVKDTAKLVATPTNVELIDYIANLIENLVSKNDKIDKEQLLIDILKNIFPNITDDEIDHVKASLQFLINSNAIKKITNFKYLSSYSYDVFKKTFTFNLDG